MRKTTRSPVPPEGFHYQADVLPLDEERALVEQIRELALKEFDFHGFVGKRRTLSYGWRYDFGEERLRRTDEIPPFLHKLRERATALAGLAPGDLPHALVTEYSPDTTIGWHRDKGIFGDVVGRPPGQWNGRVSSALGHRLLRTPEVHLEANLWQVQVGDVGRSVGGLPRASCCEWF